ncbi:MAG TPA: CsgG/HfaB family protein [Candidatus Cloacimonas sp.]|nr:CsgG/HfaB family protein [Candidatus Cloacimonas sp.]
MKYLAIIIMLPMLFLMACARNQAPAQETVTNLTPAPSTPVLDSEFHLKKKIAVGRFTNETRLANSFLSEGSDAPQRLSKAANDLLSAKLASSQRFILIERQDDLALDKEQRISNISSYQIPADYLILGSITDFGRKNTGNVGLFDRTKKQTAYAKVSLRIVDTRSGMVIFGQEGAGEASSETATTLGMGSQANFDETLTAKAIDAAIGSVIQNLVYKLASDPWRSYILEVKGKQMFISGGAKQGVREGDVFFVYQRGKEVINPQTKMPVELPGTKIATLKVVQLIPGDELNEISLAELVEGELNGDLSELYVSEK